MDYLKRNEALSTAIVNAFKGRPWEERHAELDKLYGFIKEMIAENAEAVCGQITMMVTGGEGTQASHLKNMCRGAKEINLMCSQYGVEPMFPEAEDSTKPNEVVKAFSTYMEQLREADRLSRDV